MTDRDEFERAFVATLYALGRRKELARGLLEPGPAATQCESRLDKPERADRARGLASELRVVVSALDARRLA